LFTGRHIVSSMSQKYQAVYGNGKFTVHGFPSSLK
jgi:hypothetical protein